MEYQYKGKTSVDPTLAVRRPKTTMAQVAASSGDRSLAQVLAAAFGAVFLLVAAAGFIPGLTTNYDELSLLGTDSNAELLGLFRVSIAHNLVHALFGVGLLTAARTEWAKAYLLGGGVAYLAVALYGLVIDLDTELNFLPVNTADNLLHVGLSVAMLGAGLLAVAKARTADATA